MNNKLQPALIAGGTWAAISIILSLVATLLRTPGEQASFAVTGSIGCLSILLMVAAGALAVYFYVRRSSVPARTVDGAVLGLLTGLIGSLINFLIGTPLNYLIDPDGFAQQLEPMRRANFSQNGIILAFAAGVIIIFILFSVISMIGGLIGVPIFEQRKADAIPPPPPPGFGGSGMPSTGGTSGGFSTPQAGADFGSTPPTNL